MQYVIISCLNMWVFRHNFNVFDPCQIIWKWSSWLRGSLGTAQSKKRGGGGWTFPRHIPSTTWNEKIPAGWCPTFTFSQKSFVFIEKNDKIMSLTLLFRQILPGSPLFLAPSLLFLFQNPTSAYEPYMLPSSGV